MLCPSGDLTRFTKRVWWRRNYHALAPLRCLGMAIKDLQPDLIIPCDERAVQHLHRLFRETRDHDTRAIIEGSIGAAENYHSIEARVDVLLLAKQEGVLAPDIQPVFDITDLRSWSDGHAFPWVLKIDGSWGGDGVRIVKSWDEAKAAFWHIRRPVDTVTAIGQALLYRNFFLLPPWLARTQPTVSVQSYIAGTPANCAVAAWRGEVLAGVAVETIVSVSNTGPAAAVRVVEGSDMLDAASRITRALRLTGLVGFDFIIERTTGRPYVIEINPRSVPLSHIAFGENRDVAQALVKKLTGDPRTLRASLPPHELIAYFPALWERDPNSPFLLQGYHDVPWDEPELLLALLRQEARWRGALQRYGRRFRYLYQRAWSTVEMLYK
jgi:hypothetical protein